MCRSVPTQGLAVRELVAESLMSERSSSFRSASASSHAADADGPPALTDSTQMLLLFLSLDSTLPRRGDAFALFRAAKCDPVWRDFGDLKESVAFFQENVSEVFLYEGLLLGGSAILDHASFHLRAGDASRIGSPDGHLHVGECVVEQSGTESWHTQQIGPFLSTGGFDWWTIYHWDFGTVSGLKALASDEEIGIRGHVLGPVGTQGEIIPLPPLHNHHSHVVPGIGELHGIAETNHLLECWLHGQNCYETSMAIQTHGDCQVSFRSVPVRSRPAQPSQVKSTSPYPPHTLPTHREAHGTTEPFGTTRKGC